MNQNSIEYKNVFQNCFSIYFLKKKLEIGLDLLICKDFHDFN